MLFKNRNQAGEILANRFLTRWKSEKPVVMALPKGGVPVAYPIARGLDAPLEILLVRKLSAPAEPEYALGAITEDGQIWRNRQAIDTLEPTPTEMNEIVCRAVEEMERQNQLFRKGRPPVVIGNRPVILVDDGLATGASVLAAAASLRAQGASYISVVVPVAPAQAVGLVKDAVDELIVAYEPDPFHSVGEWYENFEQVSDQVVIGLLSASLELGRRPISQKGVDLSFDGVCLKGDLNYPPDCRAWIIFAHGSGSSRKSTRNLRVARFLNEAGFGTLLFDLLSENEFRNHSNIFDIKLLAYRLGQATQWLKSRPECKALPIAYFGASTGAAAALQACAEFRPGIFAMVSRGGRPDLAWESLAQVPVPVLLIVGSLDHRAMKPNLNAHKKLSQSQIKIVRGAGHLFEEPGALEQVMQLACRWLRDSLSSYSKNHREVA